MFRQAWKNSSDSCIKFTRKKKLTWDKWSRLKKNYTFYELAGLMLIDAFSDKSPYNVSGFVAESQVKTLTMAAKLADEYIYILIYGKR